MTEVRRMCKICRTKRPKGELVRWVQGQNGLVRDDQQHMEGRGVYSCSPTCAERLTKVKVKA